MAHWREWDGYTGEHGKEDDDDPKKQIVCESQTLFGTWLTPNCLRVCISCNIRITFGPKQREEKSFSLM